MSITSSERKQMLEAIASFRSRAEELKERFWNFLVQNDPRGYAWYNLASYPGGNPVSFKAFHLSLDLDMNGNDGLYFETEMGDSEEYPVYMNIPDEYLDDPDGWEERTLQDLSYDRKIARNALVAVFGEETAANIKYTVERAGTFGRKYVQVLMDNDTIPGLKWEVFSTLTPLNKVIIAVDRISGAVFEGTVPRERYKNPEGESGFMTFAPVD